MTSKQHSDVSITDPTDITFLVVADPQFETDNPRWAKDARGRVVHHMNRIGKDETIKWPAGEMIASPCGCVIAGDMTFMGSDKTDLSPYKDAYDIEHDESYKLSTGEKVKLGVQAYPGAGNHDDGGVDKYVRDYVVNRPSVLNFHPPTKCYSWDWGIFHFVQLNNWTFDKEMKDEVKKGLIHWFEADLQEHAGKDSHRPIVIVTHKPSIKNDEVFIDILKRNQCNVTGLFCGHSHDAYVEPIKEGSCPGLLFDSGAGYPGVSSSDWDKDDEAGRKRRNVGFVVVRMALRDGAVTTNAAFFHVNEGYEVNQGGPLVGFEDPPSGYPARYPEPGQEIHLGSPIRYWNQWDGTHPECEHVEWDGSPAALLVDTLKYVYMTNSKHQLLYGTVPNDGGWVGNWYRLGEGNVASSKPAPLRHANIPGSDFVFVRDKDSCLRYLSEQVPTWKKVIDDTGRLASAPAVVQVSAVGTPRIMVFARGTNGYLYGTTLEYNGSEWENRNGTSTNWAKIATHEQPKAKLHFSPSAITDGLKVYVFISGEDGSLRYTACRLEENWDPQHADRILWDDWEQLPVKPDSSPALSLDGGIMKIAYRRKGDHMLCYLYLNVSSGGKPSEYCMGATLDDDPALLGGDLFILRDKNLYRRTRKTLNMP